MTLVEIAAAFAVGVFVGIGVALFYIKWKIGREIGAMQSEMEDMMDMTGDMNEAFEGVEEVVDEEDFEVEEKEKEDKE